MASPPGPPRRAETSPAGRCRWPGCGCTSWQTVTCSTCEPARSCAAELTPAFPTHPPRHEERAALAATRHFDLSDLRAYPGPSVHLPIEAVAFELAYRVDLPVDHLWSAVVRRFPELGGEERPRAFAELFARAVIVVQRLGMGLFATRWSVSAAGDGVATVAVQYVDPDVCRRCVELVADWLSDEDDGRPFDFEARYAEVLGRFVRSRFGGPTIYSILEAGYRAGLPTFYLESEDRDPVGLRPQAAPWPLHGIEPRQHQGHRAHHVQGPRQGLPRRSRPAGAAWRDRLRAGRGPARCRAARTPGRHQACRRAQGPGRDHRHLVGAGPQDGLRARRPGVGERR